MSSYRIVPAMHVLRQNNRYPKLDWPVDQLQVGEAFIVPTENGKDPDGRPEAYIRVCADKCAVRLGIKLSCRKVDDGMAISRVA